MKIKFLFLYLCLSNVKAQFEGCDFFQALNVGTKYEIFSRGYKSGSQKRSSFLGNCSDLVYSKLFQQKRKLSLGGRSSTRLQSVLEMQFRYHFPSNQYQIVNVKSLNSREIFYSLLAVKTS